GQEGTGKDGHRALIACTRHKKTWAISGARRDYPYPISPLKELTIARKNNLRESLSITFGTKKAPMPSPERRSNRGRPLSLFRPCVFAWQKQAAICEIGAKAGGVRTRWVSLGSMTALASAPGSRRCCCPRD